MDNRRKGLKMNASYNRLNILADRTRQGDVTACQELRKELEPVMKINVRRTLEGKGSSSSLARRIMSEYRRLVPEPKPMSEVPRQLVKHLTQTLCNHVLERLQTMPGDRQALLDTVLA